MLIDSIDPTEKRVIAFDFSGDLAVGETLSGTIETFVQMAMGSDPVPANVLNGTATFNVTSTQVLVPVKGAIADRDYAIRISVGTTNAQKKLSLWAELPIREKIRG